MKKVILTRAGYSNLKDELDYLKRVKRKEISKQLEQARLLGDLSENAEYDAAKDAQAHLEKRIAGLEDTLSHARLIDEEDISDKLVLIGATVTLEDLIKKEKIIYTLVSSEEADFSKNKISIASPIGKGLLGHKKEQIVEIKVPSGILKYKIIRIERLH